MIPPIAGLLAGFAHVFSGPDHLAAVAPLAMDSRHRAWRAGLRWGLGHTSGVLIVGLLALLLRGLLPVERLSGYSERLVGVVLIGIGAWGFVTLFRKRFHVHRHLHEGQEHVHVHLHTPGAVRQHNEPATHRHGHAALAVGTLHGLAGSAHILGILPALAYKERLSAILYLAGFGGGTVLAMVAFAALLGFVSGRWAERSLLLWRWLMGACAAAALGVGTWWLVS